MSGAPSEWLRFAEEDLAMARVLFRSTVPPRGAAFFAPQAVGKAIKAVLVSQGHKVPKTHDLLELASRLTSLANPLSNDQLTALSDYAVDSRHPDDMPEVNEDEAHAAIEAADTMLAAVRAALGG